MVVERTAHRQPSLQANSRQVEDRGERTEDVKRQVYSIQLLFLLPICTSGEKHPQRQGYCTDEEVGYGQAHQKRVHRSSEPGVAVIRRHNERVSNDDERHHDSTKNNLYVFARRHLVVRSGTVKDGVQTNSRWKVFAVVCARSSPFDFFERKEYKHLKWLPIHRKAASVLFNQL